MCDSFQAFVRLRRPRGGLGTRMLMAPSERDRLAEYRAAEWAELSEIQAAHNRNMRLRVRLVVVRVTRVVREIPCRIPRRAIRRARRTARAPASEPDPANQHHLGSLRPACDRRDYTRVFSFEAKF